MNLQVSDLSEMVYENPFLQHEMSDVTEAFSILENWKKKE